MINCSFDQELLTGYYDGELDARDNASVEEHIAACSDCLRSLGELKLVAVQVRSLPRVTAPVAVAVRVVSEIGSPFGGRTRAWLQVAVAAAALLLVGVSVIIVAARGEAPASEVARFETPAPAPKASSRPVHAEKQEQEKILRNQPELKEGVDAEEKLRKNEHGEGAREDRKALDELKKTNDLSKKDQERARGDDHNESDDTRPRDLKRGEQPEGGKAADPAKPPTTEAPAPAEKPAEKKEDWGQKDADKGAKAAEEAKKVELQKKEKSAAAAAAPAVLLIRGVDLGKARAEVEALLKDFAKRGATLTIGAKELGEDANIKDRCMTVELTDAELVELKKMLGGLKTVEVANGSFAEEQDRAVAWRRKLEAENKSKKGDDEQLAQKEPNSSGGNAPKPATPAKQPAKDAGKETPDAQPATADGKTDKPEQGGGAGGGSGFSKGGDGRMGGRGAAPARVRYILVFEEKKPPTTKDK